MARTKASVGAKISSGKSNKARCSVAPTTSIGVTSGSSDKASRSSGGGNSVCHRDTPKWQRPITNFFINKHDDSRESDDGAKDGEAAGSSKSKPKRNIIESSDEEQSPQKPKNKELDETIELETLTGEDSHKIEEYYPKGVKGKGVGKKTRGKPHNGINEGDGNSVGEGDGSSIGKGDSNSNGEGENKEQVEEGIDVKEDQIEVDVSSESEGKENINFNRDGESEEINKTKKKTVKSNKERSKRERDDQIEEGNVSKKVKVM